MQEKEAKEIQYYIEFFRRNKIPQNHIEEVPRDAKDIYLGMSDALERMGLLRIELEKLKHIKYTDLQWEEFCKQYFITHSFYTRYATRQYGAVRSKNYYDLERRIDRLKAELYKEKRSHEKTNGEEILSDKENEDLFRIAFRNYINLVGLADRKAGLLIQVNSIIASVIIGFAIRKNEDWQLYAVPVAMILIVAAVTIFFGILASKPLEKKFFKEVNTGKETFFFGSFDRLDPNFNHVTWEKYSNDIAQFFGGDKKLIFNELIKESFQVRKVLSKKFNYLSLAYKIFFAGFLISILVLCFVIIFRGE